MLRPDSIYDDSPAEHYQFPKQYLNRAEGVAGDWVVYLEPTKVRSSRGYFGIARVQEIISDPVARNMYRAIIEPGTYLDFAQPVPFSDLNGPIERGLLNENGRLSGRAQSAVRPITPSDFLRIIEVGLEQREPDLPRVESRGSHFGLAETQVPISAETDRYRLRQLTTRVARDRVFRRVVLRAYDERCAITGLKFINGGGRAEVEAAQIRPVKDGGPDIVHNGIALSGTAHWMFDRGLIGLSENLEILISRQVNDVESLKAFVNDSGHAILPKRVVDRPHPGFVAWHRENCFKA